MKYWKLIVGVFALAILGGIIQNSYAQTVPTLEPWFYTTYAPTSSVITTRTTSTQVQVPELGANVPCIGTNASSVLSTGTCSGGSGSSTLIYASSGISATASGTNGYIIGNTGVTSFNGATGTVSYAYSRAFTATVCASNASDTTNCDYKAASTQSDIVLNQAIAAVCASGSNGTVKLSSGLFNVSSSPTVSNCSNLTITGDGAGTILKLQTSTLSSGISISNSNNITVQNLQIDGNKLNVASSGFNYAVQSDINFTSSTNLTFQNLILHDSKQGGITGNSSQAIKILSNTIYNNYDNGVFLRPTPSGGASVSGITIANNIVYGQSFTGIQILCGSDFTISNNISHDNGGTSGQGSGIGASASASGTIQGNTSFNNNVQAINVDASQECNASSTAVGSSFVTVSGNTAMNASSSDGDAGDITAEGSNNITITGNNIYGGYFGINLADERGLPEQQTMVSNNNVQSTVNLGIYVEPGTTTSSVYVSNDVVQNSGAHDLYSVVPVFVDGGIYSGAKNGAEGIDLDTGSNSSTIENAYIYDNADNGILINGTSANDTIMNNRCSNQAGSQARCLYEVGGAGPTHMIGNFITNQVTQPYYFNNAASTYTTLDDGSGNATIANNLTITPFTGTKCLHEVSGVVSTTASDCGAGGGGGVATTTTYSTGYLQEASSSGAITNSPVYSGSATTISIGTTTVNGIVNVVNASNTAALRISATTGATSSAVTLNVLGNASTSPTAPVNIFQILSDGHINATGTQPNMGTCGSSPSVIGSDAAGTITVGSGVVTSCTINWQVPYETTNYRCLATDNSAAISSAVTAQTTSTATFGLSATLGGGNIFYMCSETL